MKTLCTLVGNTNKYILFIYFNLTDTCYDPRGKASGAQSCFKADGGMVLNLYTTFLFT